MFTGLVDCIATVKTITEFTYVIETPLDYLQDCSVGDSIAINGTCLTATSIVFPYFSIDTTPETLKCTNLGDLKVGSKVNLEKALLPSTRMGGHFVQGHVDCTITIIERFEDKNSIWFTFKVPLQQSKYIVEKGFVCLDGISLTACSVDKDTFSIMMIPHTQENVALFYKEIGDRVNLEVDMLSKMVERHQLFK